MRTYETFLTLIAELEGDFLELKRIGELNRRAWLRIENGADDPLDWGALGYTLHTLYGVLENYFLRISKCFENNLPADRWHKVLVEKMSLEIPGLRPSFFKERSSKLRVLELLKFRYRFRNLYGEDLDPGRTKEIQKIAEEFFLEFPVLHGSFIEKVKAIAEAVR